MDGRNISTIDKIEGKNIENTHLTNVLENIDIEKELLNYGSNTLTVENKEELKQKQKLNDKEKKGVKKLKKALSDENVDASEWYEKLRSIPTIKIISDAKIYEQTWPYEQTIKNFQEIKDSVDNVDKLYDLEEHTDIPIQDTIFLLTSDTHPIKIVSRRLDKRANEIKDLILRRENIHISRSFNKMLQDKLSFYENKDSLSDDEKDGYSECKHIAIIAELELFLFSNVNLYVPSSDIYDSLFLSDNLKEFIKLNQKASSKIVKDFIYKSEIVQNFQRNFNVNDYNMNDKFLSESLSLDNASEHCKNMLHHHLSIEMFHVTYHMLLCPIILHYLNSVVCGEIADELENQLVQGVGDNTKIAELIYYAVMRGGLSDTFNNELICNTTLNETVLNTVSPKYPEAIGLNFTIERLLNSDEDLGQSSHILERWSSILHHRNYTAMRYFMTIVDDDHYQTDELQRFKDTDLMFHSKLKRQFYPLRKDALEVFPWDMISNMENTMRKMIWGEPDLEVNEEVEANLEYFYRGSLLETSDYLNALLQTNVEKIKERKIFIDSKEIIEENILSRDDIHEIMQDRTVDFFLECGRTFKTNFLIPVLERNSYADDHAKSISRVLSKYISKDDPMFNTMAIHCKKTIGETILDIIPCAYRESIDENTLSKISADWLIHMKGHKCFSEGDKLLSYAIKHRYNNGMKEIFFPTAFEKNALISAHKIITRELYELVQMLISIQEKRVSEHKKKKKMNRVVDRIKPTLVQLEELKNKLQAQIRNENVYMKLHLFYIDEISSLIQLDNDFNLKISSSTSLRPKISSFHIEDTIRTLNMISAKTLVKILRFQGLLTNDNNLEQLYEDKKKANQKCLEYNTLSEATEDQHTTKTQTIAEVFMKAGEVRQLLCRAHSKYPHEDGATAAIETYIECIQRTMDLIHNLGIVFVHQLLLEDIKCDFFSISLDDLFDDLEYKLTPTLEWESNVLIQNFNIRWPTIEYSRSV